MSVHPIADGKRYVVMHGDRAMFVAAGASGGAGQVVIDIWGPAGHINFRLETSSWVDEIRPLRDLLNSLQLDPKPADP